MTQVRITSQFTLRLGCPLLAPFTRSELALKLEGALGGNWISDQEKGLSNGRMGQIIVGLISVLNVVGITITVIGAVKMYSEATANRETTASDLINLKKNMNKEARFNAKIVIFGALLQLFAALLDS